MPLQKQQQQSEASASLVPSSPEKKTHSSEHWVLKEQTKDTVWSAVDEREDPVHMSVLTVGQRNKRREGVRINAFQ